MKKVVAASLFQESNSFSPKIANWNDFKIFEKADMLKKIAVTRIFNEAGYEIIPTLYALAVPGGRVEEDSFRKFMEYILECIPEDGSVDGVWLYLHGAMHVEGLGSAEAELVKQIRGKTGQKIPISVALDFHANISKELIENANIICGYKTAPHADIEETQIKAGNLLIKCIEEKILPRPLMIKLPLLITGERATTAVEPVKTIMREINMLEEKEGILSASYFAGMAWVDAPHSGASIVIVQRDEKVNAAEDAKRIASIAWNAREEFSFEEETAEPEEAFEIAGRMADGPIFITDSGDNVTAGSPGDNAYLLKLAVEKKSENILIAGILDKKAVYYCSTLDVGKKVEFRLGGEIDPEATIMDVNGTLRWKGRMLDNSGEKRTNAIVVSIEGVDVIITDDRCAFTAPEIIESAGISINEYKIIVVKQGYLYAELRKIAKHSLMAFSPGSGCQDIKRFNYINVKRPIFPLDTDFTWQPDDSMIIEKF
jgi:microcystin degradation protein MlrC